MALKWAENTDQSDKGQKMQKHFLWGNPLESVHL
jgi:hypothetical protein